MYDNYFDVIAGMITTGFILLLIRLMISRPLGWRDFSVVILTIASVSFWSLIALRRWLDWPLEVALAAFILKFIGITAVNLHVWTQDRKNVNRPDHNSR